MLGADRGPRRGRFWQPALRGAPSATDSGVAQTLDVSGGDRLVLAQVAGWSQLPSWAGWRMRREVAEPVAGPQPNSVCCWQPGQVGSLRSLLLNQLQQKLVR